MERIIDEHNFEATPEGWPGRCRAQVLRGSEGTIVLLTQHMVLNDGQSLTNNPERFSDALRERFFPESTRRPEFISRYVVPGVPTSWDTESDLNLMRLTKFDERGDPYWSRPDDRTVAFLRQNADPDRGNAYVPEPEPKLLNTRWVRFPVNSLPVPRRLFRAQCMVDALGDEANDFPPPMNLRTCGCPYHAANWQSAVDIATEALRIAHAQPVNLDDTDEIAARAVSTLPTGIDPATLDAARSLLSDALILTGDLIDYVNGQHRSMAIHDQSVRDVPLIVTYSISAAPPAPLFAEVPGTVPLRLRSVGRSHGPSQPSNAVPLK